LLEVDHLHLSRRIAVSGTERASLRPLDHLTIGLEFHSALSLSALKTLLAGLGEDFRLMRETLRACPLAENDLTRVQE
jgi:hypothetical protein